MSELERSLDDARREFFEDLIDSDMFVWREHGSMQVFRERGYNALAAFEAAVRADERARVLPAASGGEMARAVEAALSASPAAYPWLDAHFALIRSQRDAAEAELVALRARVLPDGDGAELPYAVHLSAAHWALTKALELYPPGEPTTPDPDEPLTYEDGAQSGYVAGYQAALAARVLGSAADRTRHSNAEWQEAAQRGWKPPASPVPGPAPTGDGCGFDFCGHAAARHMDYESLGGNGHQCRDCYQQHGVGQKPDHRFQAPHGVPGPAEEAQ